MSYKAQIEAEILNVDSLRMQLEVAKTRLKGLMVLQVGLDCGVAVGDVVMSRGCKYQVTAIDTRWSTPWLTVRKFKKDGALGKVVHNLCDDWETSNAE